MVEESITNQPHKGDEIVIYINKFKPECYVEGVRIVTEDFYEVLKKSKQNIFTQLFHNPEKCEAGFIRFFKNGESVEKWHANKDRKVLVEKLKPLYSEPLFLHRFKLGETLCALSSPAESESPLL